MIYLKSALVGLLAVVLAGVSLVILGTVGVFVYSMIHPPPQETSIGWDPITLMTIRISWKIWGVALLSFSTGSVWEFRRLTHR